METFGLPLIVVQHFFPGHPLGIGIEHYLFYKWRKTCCSCWKRLWYLTTVIALSIDYGITWSDVPLSAFALWTTTKNWKTIASSANGDKIIAATSVDANTNRIWTSSDGGATWTNQTNAPANKVWQGVSSSADGTKLAAVATGAWSTTPVVCTSNDSGVTWTEHTSLPSFVWMGVASSADGIKIAIVTYHGDIWTSSDSGVSLDKM